jgi:pyridoxamine 5'-phosphate oxidase
MSVTQTPDPGALRRSYERGALTRDDLDPDPVAQFRAWFTEASETPAVIEPNAMSLSTVDAAGHPNSRTVLLKAYDERGLVFFTNYESRKAREIEANPRVALLFPWLALERQVKIQGVTEKISRVDSVKYFLSRPIGHRLGAWVSNQSSVVGSKGLLLAKLEEMKRKFADGEIPCPDFWGGYRVVPTRFEFWQGGRDRIHDRFEYLRDGNSWVIQRLAP